MVMWLLDKGLHHVIVFRELGFAFIVALSGCISLLLAAHLLRLLFAVGVFTFHLGYLGTVTGLRGSWLSIVRHHI